MSRRPADQQDGEGLGEPCRTDTGGNPVPGESPGECRRGEKAEQRPVGAFAGAYLFPDMLASSWGIRSTEVVAGIVSVAGILLTVALPPEPKGKSLEELGSTPQSIASKRASGATLSQAS